MSFYEKTGSSASGMDHRRKWDTAEYEAKAQQRIQEAREEAELKNGKKPRRDRDEPKVQREMLQVRDYKVDLTSKLGRTTVINKTTPSAEAGGYYCDICDCVMKDSINFLDHINGKNHQRNLGMSMKVKKSTVDEVKERLAIKKIEMEQRKREEAQGDRQEDIKEEEARIADYRLNKKERKRKREEESAEASSSAFGELDPEMQAMMGFGGFGTSKK